MLAVGVCSGQRAEGSGRRAQSPRDPPWFSSLGGNKLIMAVNQLGRAWKGNGSRSRARDFESRRGVEHGWTRRVASTMTDWRDEK